MDFLKLYVVLVILFVLWLGASDQKTDKERWEEFDNDCKEFAEDQARRLRRG